MVYCSSWWFSWAVRQRSTHIFYCVSCEKMIPKEIQADVIFMKFHVKSIPPGLSERGVELYKIFQVFCMDTVSTQVRTSIIKWVMNITDTWTFLLMIMALCLWAVSWAETEQSARCSPWAWGATPVANQALCTVSGRGGWALMEGRS